MTQGIKAIFEIVDRATAPIRKIGGAFTGLMGPIRAVSAGMQRIGGALKQAGMVALKFGAVAAGAFAAAGVAMAGMVGHAMDVAKAMSFGAEKTGIALKTYQGLAYAAEGAGSNVDEMADAVKDFNEKLVEASSGNKDLAANFARMGVKLKDARGQLRPTEDILLDVADAFARVPDGAKKSAAAMALFGDAGVNLIPMLNKGRAGIREAADEAERFGLILDEDAAASFKRLDANIMRVRRAAQGLGMTIATKLIPIIEPLISRFTDWMMVNRELIAVKVGEWFKALPDAIESARNAFERWGKALAPLVRGIGGLVERLGPMNVAIGAAAALIGGTLLAVVLPAATAITSLGVAVARLAFAPAAAAIGTFIGALRAGTGVMAAFNAVLLANPIGATIVAVAALAGAAYLIYRNWESVGPWFSRLWEGVKQVFNGIREWVAGIFTGDFSRAANGIREAFSGLGSYLSTFWGGVKAAFESFLGFLDSSFGTTFKDTFAAMQGAIEGSLAWIETNLASRLKGAFDTAYSFVKPVIDAITGAIAGIRSGIEWVQSLSPSNFMPNFGGAPAPAPAGAPQVAPAGRTAPGRGGRVAPPQAPNVDAIFGPGGRAGGPPGSSRGKGGVQEPVQLTGKIAVDINAQGRITNQVASFSHPGIDGKVNTSAGLSNAFFSSPA